MNNLPIPEVIFTFNEVTKIQPELHPVNNWILATTNDDTTVVILDYVLNSKVLEFSVTMLEEEKKDLFLLQRSVEKVKSEKVGQIKCVKFFDQYTRNSRAKKADCLQTCDVSNKNNINDAFNGVIVLAEYKVLMIDYNTHKIQEVKMSAFEGKAPTCVEFFGSSQSSIAFGGLDGSIRIWDLESCEIVKILSGAHSIKNGGVKCLLSYEDEVSGKSTLISAALDGQLVEWDIETGNSRTLIKHTDSISNISYNPQLGYLTCVTSDRLLIVWDVFNKTEVARRSCGKYYFASIHIFTHPSFITCLLVCKKDGSVAHLVELHKKVDAKKKEIKKENLVDLIDLTQVIPSKKDKSKFYETVVHPLNSTLILCVTNRGLILVAVERFVQPKIAISRVPSVKTWAVYSCDMTNEVVNVCDLLSNPTTLNTVLKAPPGESLRTKDLSVSTTGDFLALIYEEKYQIYSSSNWQVIEQGTGKAVAWSMTENKYAVLELVQTVKDEKKKKKGKEKYAPPAPMISIIRIKDGTNSTELKVPHTPHMICGGPLLGIWMINDTNNNNENSNNTNNNNSELNSDINEEKELVFQFFGWEKNIPIGGKILPPLQVLWDSSQRYCVLTYKEYFCVFLSSIAFSFIGKFSYSIVSGVFYGQTFFFSTPNSLYALFPHKEDSFPLLIATNSKAFTHNDVLSHYKDLSISVLQCPIGNLSVMGVVTNTLWVMDSINNFHSLSIHQPLLQFLMLVQNGNINEALEFIPMFDSRFHFSLVMFMSVRGFAQHAMSFSGLSVWTKFNFCAKYNLLETALEVIPQLVNSLTQNQSGASLPYNFDVLGGICVEMGKKAQDNNNEGTALRAYQSAANLSPSFYPQLIRFLALKENLPLLQKLKSSLETSPKFQTHVSYIDFFLSNDLSVQ